MKPERIIPFERWEVTNGDYYLICKRLRDLAAKKVVKVESVIVSPKTSKWLGRISWGFILLLGVIVAINIIVAVVR